MSASYISLLDYMISVGITMLKFCILLNCSISCAKYAVRSLWDRCLSSMKQTSANGRRLFTCNTFTYWLTTYSAIDWFSIWTNYALALTTKQHYVPWDICFVLLWIYQNGFKTDLSMMLSCIVKSEARRGCDDNSESWKWFAEYLRRMARNPYRW